MRDGKMRAVTLLIVAEIAALALWFSSSAVLPEMATESGLSPGRLAWLAAGVQVGFAFGAVGFAVLGLADRFDPRWVFCVSALVAAAANLSLLAAPIGGVAAVGLRLLTGAALAGVYPVGMKIAVGWGKEDRGLLVSLLVGGLTLGSASPHLIAIAGGADWRFTIAMCSGLAALGGVAVLASSLGPYHARAPRLDPRAVALAWTDRRVRFAILAYLGHMWELYAFWGWVGVIAERSFALSGGVAWEAAPKLVAFLAIGLGGIACIPAGWFADRHGKARVAGACLVASGAAGLASALLFGGDPTWLGLALVIWGIAIIPDSALYSALVADAAPPERAGSLMTVQVAVGFLFSAGIVQAMPIVAGAVGWSVAMALLALGPVAGLWALKALTAQPSDTASGDRRR